jgi:hypothetical protein
MILEKFKSIVGLLIPHVLIDTSTTASGSENVVVITGKGPSPPVDVFNTTL